QRDVALARETIDQLARDDLFDGARRALDVDAHLLEQRADFLAAGIEQLGDFINPNSGQAVYLFRRASKARTTIRRAWRPGSSRPFFHRRPVLPTVVRRSPRRRLRQWRNLRR